MPAGASVSKNKANGANGPVNIHGDPNAHHTHAKIFGKQIPKADAEDPHGKNGNHHAEFYIVGSALLWGSLMLTVLYTLIRPFIQTLILPLNLFLGGLLTPLTDALLVSWTAACVHGLSLGYWDGVLVSLAIGAAYLPYARRRRGREATLPS